MSAEPAVDSSSAPPPGDASRTDSPAPRRRRLLPRFRLPAAFAFAILFCFFFAWVRSNYVRMLEEEAAVDAVLQIDADIGFVAWRESRRHSDSLSDYLDLKDRSFLARLGRTLNLRHPPRIDSVTLKSEDPNDPKRLPALAGLRRFPELWQVELHGPGFDDRAIAELAKVDSLGSLQLFRTRITGDGLTGLADHESLRSIAIVGDPKGDLLHGVLSLKNLTLVSLSGTPLRNDDLETLASFPQLLQLHLSRISFSGRSSRCSRSCGPNRYWNSASGPTASTRALSSSFRRFRSWRR